MSKAQVKEDTPVVIVSLTQLLKQSSTEKAISMAIEQLVESRKHWERNELATANDTLYGILQHCYALHNTMIGNDSLAKTLRKGLGNYITANDYKFTDSTPLITKIIKCVFGTDRKRVNSYSTAMRVALIEKISVIELPKYLKEKGGVEEVRRQGVVGKSIKVKIELGRTVLEDPILARVQNESLSASFSSEQTEEGVILLATREDDGSFAIRRLIQNTSAVKAALAACSSVGAEKEKAKKIEDDAKALEDDRMSALSNLKVA
jgi:hypothetical protein